MSRLVGTLRGATKGLVKQALRRAFHAGSSRAAKIPAEYWGLSSETSGTLSLEGVELSRLVTDHGSPLHVVSASRLRSNARRFTAGSPAVEIFYSYKTNPVPGVLQELHRAGVGAEVISEYELWLALRLGVPPSKIVYNGPAKSEASVRRAIALGIELLNVNHREELPVLARLATELGRRPRVGIRVTLGGWAGQFGTPAAGGKALSVFEDALGMGCLDVTALHVHRGGMIHSEGEASEYLDAVLGFADELRERLGLKLTILDIGGSLASPSVRSLSERELRLNRTFLRELQPPQPQASLGIEGYLGLLQGRVTEHFRLKGEAAPRVFLEPGRSLTSDAQMLLSSVLSVKHDDERTFAILDAGINLAESCRSEYHQLLPVSRYTAAPTKTYALAGPICTPGDTLRWAVRLPELSCGDTLAIMDTGAYFVPFATSFSFPRPGVVMVDQGNVSTLRRAETFEDLVAYDSAPSAAAAEHPAA